MSSFLHDIGLQMLSLFILFYLWQLGWSLMIILAYILIFTLLRPLFQRVSSGMIIRFGIAKTVLLSNVLRVLFTAALFSLGDSSSTGYGLLALVLLLDVASLWIYYTVWDFYFSGTQKRKQSSKQLAFAWELAALASVLAPLASGFLAQTWGFRTSMIAASVLLFFSVIPLLLIGRQESVTARLHMKQYLKFKKYWELFKNTPKKNLLSFAISNMIFNVFLPLWMLYLGIVVFTDKAYSGLGFLLAISAAATILVTFIAGRLVDKGYYKPLLRGSGWAEFVLGGLRFFVVSIPGAIVHNFLLQQSQAHSILIFKWYYGQDDKQAERLAFFQMCRIFEVAIHSLIVVTIIASLWVFKDNQLDVLRFACIALGLLGPLMIGLSLKKKRFS